MANKPKETRICMSCRTAAPRNAMIRIVRKPSGEVVLDGDGRIDGRGAYLCKNKACIEKAILQKRVERALSCRVAETIYKQL